MRVGPNKELFGAQTQVCSELRRREGVRPEAGHMNEDNVRFQRDPGVVETTALDPKDEESHKQEEKDDESPSLGAAPPGHGKTG